MRIVEFFKKEFEGFKRSEKIFFAIILILTILISIYLKDSKIALVSAICGMSYTILAGKGKISCYFIGMIGTFCYCYLSFKNQFWGNLALYLFYYFPMEIIGITRWLKHLKKDKQEIVKKRMSKKQIIAYFFMTFVLSILLYLILKKTNGNVPILDSIIVSFSILGQLLTVKRCIEQWYCWFIVNFLSIIIWIIAYIQGSNCFATIIMWIVYLILTFYFLKEWKKELS